MEQQQHRGIPHEVDADASPIKLRDQQVKAMCAGKEKEHTHLPTAWPEASPGMIAKWSERHPSFKSFSSNYMASQRRILFLADLPPSKRFEAFEAVCFQRRLAPTTAETYWTTWLGIQKALALTPSEADTRVTRMMKARAAAYPVQFPNPAAFSDMDLLVSTFRDSHPSFCAIVMATFLLGQRISDMVQLAAFDLQPASDLLTITIRRGKTMGISQPYTLWLRRNVYPTESLLECAAQATKENRLYLFSHENCDDERTKVLHQIRDMLTSINEKLELRSIRRGGLHRMARAGNELQTILYFSRHADVKMLLRYLNWGEHAEARRQAMIEVVDQTTSEMTTTEAMTMNFL